MNVAYTKIEIGLPAPIRVLHASDTHLTHADERDGQRKVELAKNRLAGFPEADERLAALGKLSLEMGLPIMQSLSKKFSVSSKPGKGTLVSFELQFGGSST